MAEESDRVDGEITPIVSDPLYYWEALQEYPDSDEAESCLRSIPEDMAEALELEPAVYIQAVSRLPGLMAHWSTRLALAKSRFGAAKAAKDIGLESLKADRRKHLAHTRDKFTEAMVNERAKATGEYARLCLAETRAENEYLKVKGLVDAIVTKREALKMLSIFVRQEIGLAHESRVGDYRHNPAEQKVEVHTTLRTINSGMTSLIRGNGS